MDSIAQNTNWRNASHHDPCPVCHKDDWCFISEDGSIVGCRREGGRKARTDKTGMPYWLYIRLEDGSWNEGAPRTAVPPIDPEAIKPRSQRHYSHEAASPEDRNAAYTALLRRLDLEPHHQQHLLADRGMNTADIQAAGYNTWIPSKRAIDGACEALLDAVAPGARAAYKEARKMTADLGADPAAVKITDHISDKDTALLRDLILSIPGFWYDGKELRMGGAKGIVLPIRDVQRRIIALQIRLDDPSKGAKYLPPCSPRTIEPGGQSGAPMGQHAHVPLTSPQKAARVVLTEGVFKADILSRSGVRGLEDAAVIALPSVGAYRVAEETLRAMGATTVMLAYDADTRRKGMVAGALCQAAIHYSMLGYQIEVVTWSPDKGKGIDDVILGRNEQDITIVRGREAWVWMAERRLQAGIGQDDRVEARITAADLAERCKADKAYPFDPTVTQALHTLGQGTREAERLYAQLEDIIGKRQTAKVRRNVSLLQKAEKESEEQDDSVLFLRGSEVEIARHLIDALGGMGSLLYDDGAVWHYDGTQGIWTEVSQESLVRRIMDLDGSVVAGVSQLRVTKHLCDGAIALMQAELSDEAAKTGRRFSQAPPGVCLQNGFACLQNGHVRILPYSPDHLARHKVPCDYPENPNVSLIQQFLDDVLKNPDGTIQLDAQQLVMEYAGTCLVGQATKYEKALILVGEPGSGKSTLEEILRAPFGQHGLCSLKPQDWGGFRLAGLRGKLLNIVDEVPASLVASTDVYRAVVSGQPVTAEQKYREPFDFRPIAGHIMACNELPVAGDDPGGFWRRNFPLELHGKVENPIPGFAQKIVSEGLAGIVFWMLEGAARVQKRGGFNPPDSCQQLNQKWKEASDPVAAWAASKIMPDPNAKTEPEQMWRAYADWAKDNGYKPITSSTFTRRLGKLHIKSVSSNGQRHYGYKIASFGDLF